ncbi:MAG: ATP-binding protein [Bacteroidales bacterium]|jgi:predicted AAA+ superfamily ATPase|nr:ATP-binding protein [Bacteroidales bacterium]
MQAYVKRDTYLNRLIVRRNNNMVKAITGPRRAGKSFLLNPIFKDYLLEQGVQEDHIISISFDIEDEDTPRELLDREKLKEYLYSRIISKTEPYYVFLDEIQEVENFEKIVNGLNNRPNVDVYITGSNSKFLSNDIITIFRGRSDEVNIMPFTFKEFCQDRQESVGELWKEYYTFGGLPALRMMPTYEQKTSYLQRLWKKTYLDDVVERHHVENREALEAITDALCSSVGSLTNTSRITNTLASVRKIKISDDTVSKYIGYLEEAFLFNEAKRYNIKGNKYYENIKKYYSVDVGLRNVRLNYRQLEQTHLMENIIFNELLHRGYVVDVGVIEARVMKNGKSEYKQYEVDFIATNGNEKYYIQSAYELSSDTKREQELNSLNRIDDSFQKIVIVKDDIMPYRDEKGIYFTGLFQFLMSDKIVAI